MRWRWERLVEEMEEARRDEEEMETEKEKEEMKKQKKNGCR